MTGGKKVVFETEVYTYQIDYVGHVSNIVYIQWMEIGRLKLLDAIDLPVKKLEETGIAPVLVETNIKYKKSLYVEEKVTIEVWISELQNVSAILQFRFYNGNGELVATGWQKGLFVNREKMKIHRLTPEEREAFKKVLIEPE